jgi:hypothetical protein
MLLTSADAPPCGGGWAHEMKIEGFRCIAEVAVGRVPAVVEGRQRHRESGTPGLSDDVTVVWRLLSAQWMSTPGRPPTVVAQTVDAGSRAVFGFPIRLGWSGWRRSTCDRSGPLSDDQYANASVMAEAAARAILSSQPTPRRERWRPSWKS